MAERDALACLVLLTAIDEIPSISLWLCQDNEVPMVFIRALDQVTRFNATPTCMDTTLFAFGDQRSTTMTSTAGSLWV